MPPVFPKRLSALLAAAVLASSPRSSPPSSHAGSPPGDTLVVRAREGTALSFDLAPDGRSFVLDLLGQLWEVPVEGGAARAITTPAEGADDRQPTISPDGGWIATRSDRPRGRGIWLIERAGETRRPLTDSALILGGDVGAPAWSPDGRQLAYVDGGRIVLLDLETAARRPLATVGLENASLDEPAWSPDGRRLLVSGPWRGGPPRPLLEGSPGAGIWEVDVDGGSARSFTPEGVAARAPAYAPDGRRVAYFTARESGGFQLLVQATDGPPREIAADPGIEPRRVRWSPDGETLFFVARGRLRRVPAGGGASEEVPFLAELRATRARYERRPIRFPEPGETVDARGFAGIALAPDGGDIAILALGKLWLVDPGGPSRAVADVPPSAFGLTWSPDGRRVAWSAGAREGEDVWVTDIASGGSRRLTRLSGSEVRAAWSPDGRWIAFTHWAEPESPPGSGTDGDTYVRLVDADAQEAATVDATRDLGPIGWEELSAFASALQWMPRGDTLLAFGMNGWPVASRRCVEAALLPVAGARRPVESFPCRPSHVALGADGSLLAIEDGVLTHRPRIAEGWGEPDWRGADAALYPSAARDGAVLFVAGDGLRLREAGGGERRIGWPLRFRAPAAPPVLLRNVRLVPLEEPGGAAGDGDRGEDAAADAAPLDAGDRNAAPLDATPGDAPLRDPTPRDILIVDGRIHRIAPAGTLAPPEDGGSRVLDAEGRWAVPGLIDPHTHLLNGGLAVPRAALFHGVTTMREMWHPLGEAASFRDAVAAGVAPGARIVVSGPPFYPSPTGASVTSDFLWIPVDSATADRGLTLLEAFGAGHVKMRYVQSWSGATAFVRRAHAHGLPVGGHCAHALPVVLAGIDTHEHLDGQCGEWELGIHDDVVQLYRAAGMIVVPIIDRHLEDARTARDTLRMHAAGVEPFMTPGMRLAARHEPRPGDLERVEGRAARAIEATRAMAAAGVRIAAGTDAFMYPGGMQRELEALVQAGLSPAAALRAATRNAAAAIGADRDLGRLEPGFRADLVILDGDPLADIRHTGRIWAVLQDGRPVDREALLRSP